MAEYDPNYVVGRGRLYFAVFAPGTRTPAHGELYLGNTPALSITTDETTLDHYSSESGLKEKDESVTLQSDMTGSFDTDEINLDNLALFFQGDRMANVTTAATGLSETVVAKRGRFYQLGADLTNGIPGVRNIDNVVVTGPEGDVALTDNIEVDLDKGRLYIEPDAPAIADDDELVITYDVLAHSEDLVITRGQQVRGQLRFISDNAVGKNKDYFWPDVKLMPNGDYQLKGDDWQTMSFNFEALRRGNAASRLIINGDTTLTPETEPEPDPETGGA